jgi:hypothetical protein
MTLKHRRKDPRKRDSSNAFSCGTRHISTGNKLDEGIRVKTGGYSYVAKGMTHYAWFTEETELQLHGTGPQGITYVDPNDDPRKAK